jgi:hypothetical protein
MGAFNFEYSDLVMRIGKLLLLTILLVVVFLFGEPNYESIVPASLTNAVSNISQPKNAATTK